MMDKATEAPEVKLSQGRVADTVYLCKSVRLYSLLS